MRPLWLSLTLLMLLAPTGSAVASGGTIDHLTYWISTFELPCGGDCTIPISRYVDLVCDAAGKLCG